MCLWEKTHPIFPHLCPCLIRMEGLLEVVRELAAMRAVVSGVQSVFVVLWLTSQWSLMYSFSRVFLAVLQCWRRFWLISGRHCTCPRIIAIASFLLVGYISCITSITFLTTCSSPRSTMCPRYSMLFYMKKHLFNRSSIRVCCSSVNTWVMCSRCSSTLL